MNRRVKRGKKNSLRTSFAISQMIGITNERVRKATRRERIQNGEDLRYGAKRTDPQRLMITSVSPVSPAS